MAKQTVLGAFSELCLGAYAIGGIATPLFGRVKCLICEQTAPSASLVVHKPDCSLKVVSDYVMPRLAKEENERLRRVGCEREKNMGKPTTDDSLTTREGYRAAQEQCQLLEAQLELWRNVRDRLRDDLDWFERKKKEDGGDDPQE